MPLQGKRILPNEDGWVKYAMMTEPGSYGRSVNELTLKATTAGWWQVQCPDNTGGTLSPEVHRIIEHEDGTITAWPSIDFSKKLSGGWHGYLIRGKWYELDDPELGAALQDAQSLL